MDAFDSATAIPSLNGASEGTPSVSEDSKTMFYNSAIVDGGTPRVIWSASLSLQGVYSNPMPVAGIGVSDSGVEDFHPYITKSFELWFSSTRLAGEHLMHAAYTGSGFGSPVAASDVNSSTDTDTYPVLSDDGLRLYFGRKGSDTQNLDVWTASRATTASPFSTPVPVPELSGADNDRPAFLSPDGCRIYLGRGALTEAITMYVASRPVK